MAKSNRLYIPWKPISRLIPFIKPYFSRMILGILCALGQAILNIVFIYLIKNLTNTALNVQFDAFINLIYLALILLVTGIIVSFFGRYATTCYKTQTIRNLRDSVVGHIQWLPLSHIESYHTGNLVSRLNSDISKIDDFLNQIPRYIYQPLLFIGAFSYMLFISWKLLLATFILIPISSLVFNKLSQPIENYSKQLREHLADVNVVFQDTISGIFIVKAFNLQEFLLQKYQTGVKQVEAKGLYIDKVNAALYFVFLLLRFIPQLVCPLYGGYLIAQGELTAGELIACIYLTWYVFLPVESLLGLIIKMKETSPAVERVFQLLDQPVEQAGPHPFKVDFEAKPLEFQNVSFGYNETKHVLNNLNFHVPKNKIVALVGPSGSGKSTIFKLICGFCELQRGTVNLYGNNVYLSDRSAARAHISFVSQDPYLFPTTIAENIAYGRLEATREEIITAAKAACAHDFIMELPQGYDTSVGERGSKLSRGQRQRIALARAVLKNAPMLLLDEPTSALDAQSEALIKQALVHLAKERTVLVIAHRLSTIREADQVLVLDQGKIVEKGRHAELIKTGSLYKNLYLKQAAAIERYHVNVLSE